MIGSVRKNLFVCICLGLFIYSISLNAMLVVSEPVAIVSKEVLGEVYEFIEQGDLKKVEAFFKSRSVLMQKIVKENPFFIIQLSTNNLPLLCFILKALR